MNICVIGTGYVGLVLGTCLADMGNQVICVDNDINKVVNLTSGQVPIYEPGLEPLIIKNVQEKRLHFSINTPSAVQQSSVCFIAVGTPPGEDGSADLQHVLTVAREIGKAMNGYKVIVNKSTVPVGTAEKVRLAISSETNQKFDVVSNPEFLKEGSAVEDFMRPSRVIIGSDSEQAKKIIAELYAPFSRTAKPIIFMSNKSAEVAKYAANAMLATRISFMNEFANLCEKVGADIEDIRKALSSDPRIGGKFLYAGTGYGGSCFPKDVKAIIKTAEDYQIKMPLLSSVEEVNHQQKTILLRKINQHFSEGIKGKTIALWGLAFKPNTDDIREAPSLEIIKGLLKEEALLKVYDPVAISEVKKIFGDKIIYCESGFECIKDAEALIIATEWNEFRNPDISKLKSLMKNSVIFDGRNLYSTDIAKRYGLVAYYSIGRG